MAAIALKLSFAPSPLSCCWSLRTNGRRQPLPVSRWLWWATAGCSPACSFPVMLVEVDNDSDKRPGV